MGALILMRDFGAALIFFITFLIIAFMNSGDIKTAGLAVAAAGLGGAIVIKYKPYVTARFQYTAIFGRILTEKDISKPIF